MNTIKFNNEEFEVNSFNKSTYFNGQLTSAATCSLENTSLEILEPLLTTHITSLQIYHNDTLIYNLSNIDAKVDTINEILEDDRMGISLNITFNQVLDND